MDPDTNPCGQLFDKLISDKNVKNGNNKAPTTTNDQNNNFFTNEVPDDKIACAFCGRILSLETAGLTSRGKRALSNGGHWFCKHCIQCKNHLLKY